MSVNDVSKVVKFKVGSFTILGILLIGALTVFVNDRPYWWRQCNPITISIEDATGLKTKSPVKSLGLQIGYLKSVELESSKVKLGICVTAPVETTPETRAYIRGEGFLGDKFVELKPVHYLGATVNAQSIPTQSDSLPSSHASSLKRSPSKEGAQKEIEEGQLPQKSENEIPESVKEGMKEEKSHSLFSFLVSDVYADEKPKVVEVGQRAGDMDKLMEKADGLMVELTNLSKNLKEGLDPKDIKTTLQQLNKTLENASKMLSPDGGLNSTARRALLKLEDAFEQLRQQATRINKGEGSVGKLLNDPVYADEMLKAMKAINGFLNKANDIRLVVHMGAEEVPVYGGSRGFLHLQILPNPSRYYLVGVSIDPRGRLQITNTTTTAGGQTNTVRTEEIQEGGILITAMLGKIIEKRYDLSMGVLHGDGAASAMIHLGKEDFEQQLSLRADVYSRAKGTALNCRLTAIAYPFIHSQAFKPIYLKAGLDTLRQVDGKRAFIYGAGVTFDDNDIKLLFSFR